MTDNADLRAALMPALTEALAPLDRAIFVRTLLAEAERCLNDRIFDAVIGDSAILVEHGATADELRAFLETQYEAYARVRAAALAELRATVDSSRLAQRLEPAVARKP
jgi:hypothetical protein